MATLETVELAFDGDVACLTLNRPEKLNSFTAGLHADLRTALSDLDARGVRALILTGAGRAFCAGQDLAEAAAMESVDEDVGMAIERDFNPLIRRLRGMPIPIVAAVNGIAAGAGANLALACDIVLAARSASFVQAFARIGLIPDCGGTWFLPRMVGEARAKGLTLLAEPLPAEKAEAWGLIWRAVVDEALMDEAWRLARHLAAQPTVALGLMKGAIQEASAHPLDRQLDLERDLQRTAARTGDFREGVAAFLEKRQPAFKGH
ncbi:MAG: 2-(1,2-epoxy-1,2-dihydrophenyl)acetyl-CoA isomerase PaaG [Parvibaculaceae bacterium]